MSLGGTLLVQDSSTGLKEDADMGQKPSSSQHTAHPAKEHQYQLIANS